MGLGPVSGKWSQVKEIFQGEWVSVKERFREVVVEGLIEVRANWRMKMI